MKRLPTYIISLLLLISNKAISQNINDLKDINSQIWSNFSKAFETVDYQLFESLHSNDLVRVNGGDYKSIRNKEAYLEGYKERWKNSSLKQTISFRFFERIYKDGLASERGIYKFTINPGEKNQKSYYGKFHVILRKEEGHWKILVDYDSIENESINEASYNNCFALNDFENIK
ncbi:nuclear transport factor 2 family protein [Flavivirga aquimarina]|uniref:Nuclear transport factor 2 family protein n=1 Tax=Flavivirga aquimarina TaxID=2027862 RepID=A0ABT8WAV2_9FLAO|nr:nuclear transport factor 2 family protein [Flavivirga aquimarina]MDO5970181.1 nuclear transport factor 2 family protein [Flavivirga aquimarina]